MYDIFLLHFLHFVHLGNAEDNTLLFRIMCVQPTIQIFRFLLVGRLGWILIFFETWVLSSSGWQKIQKFNPSNSIQHTINCLKKYIYFY